MVTALSLAAQPGSDDSGSIAKARLAAVTTSGTVVVSDDLGESWSPIHRCLADGHQVTGVDREQGSPRCGEHVLPASLAWHGDRLFFACAGSRLMAWQPGRGRVEPVPVAPAVRVVALGSRGGAVAGLLIADAHHRVWAYDRDNGFEYLAQVPRASGDRPGGRPFDRSDPAIAAIAEFDGSVVIARGSVIWRLAGTWQPLARVRGCGLATMNTPHRAKRLWIASPHGLLELGGGFMEARLIVPTTGVAIVGEQIVVAHSGQIAILPVSAPEPTAATRPGTAAEFEWSALLAQGRPRIDWFQVRRRTRWARWMPRLGAGISVHRVNGHGLASTRQHDVEIWLWITWSFPEEKY